MIRRPPRSTLFPTRRSSDLHSKTQREHGNSMSSLCLCVIFVPLWWVLVLSRRAEDRKSTRLNSSHTVISYAVFCLKKKKKLEKMPHIVSDKVKSSYKYHI